MQSRATASRAAETPAVIPTSHQDGNGSGPTYSSGLKDPPTRQSKFGMPSKLYLALLPLKTFNYERFLKNLGYRI